MILYKYQDGGMLFNYSGRPGVDYKKNNRGDWMANTGPEGEMVILRDSDGSRKAILDEQARPKSTTLRTDVKSQGQSFLGQPTQAGIIYKSTNENTKDIKPTDYHKDISHESKYLKELKFLENGIKAGYVNGVWTPHRSVEGGLKTIAYGHKLQPGEDYSKGLTEKEANKLLQKDYVEHKARAKKHVDARYGEGSFAKLPPQKQILLTDYEYNVGLTEFPKFTRAVINNDTDSMLDQYKRFSGDNEMTQRNEWTLNMIQNR
jgi:hypothetical protein